MMRTGVTAFIPRLAVPGSRSLALGAAVVCALLAAAVSAIGPGRGVSVPDFGPAAGSATAAVPLPLATAASSVIGAQDAGFRVLSRGGALIASGGGVSSSFTRAGVRLATADGAVRLSLVGAGYGARVIAVPEVAPVASGSSVTYRRTGPDEWYRNGPLGLEQGFALARRPAGWELGPLTLTLRVSGSLSARRAGSGIVFFSADGQPLLRYDGLSVRDAAGRSLPAQIALRDGKVLLRVWDRGARYPVTIDPFIEQAKLIGPASGQDLFGDSVALSPNGTTALVGAPSNDGDVGAAWVFVFKGGTWVDERKLTPPTTGHRREIGNAQFGSSVALGLSGSTALIGGPLDNRDRGAAWAFIRKGAAWIDQHKLTAPTSGPGKEIHKAEFGTGVALSSAGNTALVGGPFDNNVGAAWVFIRKGGTWIDQHKLIAPTTGPGREINIGGGGEFGWSVALASVGDTALVGGYRDDGYVGAVWVFIRRGTRWIDQHKLTAPTSGPGKELDAAYFGYSVAVSASGGDKALVGGPNDGPNNTDLGAAWAFTRSGGTWTEQQKLTAPTTGADTELGHGTVGDGVALSPDGTTALIGGLEDHGSVGAAWEFTFQPSFLKQPATWVETQKLTAPASGLGKEIGAAGFGWSVALSQGTSPTALIGGAADNSNVGAAWVFPFQEPPIK